MRRNAPEPTLPSHFEVVSSVFREKFPSRAGKRDPRIPQAPRFQRVEAIRRRRASSMPTQRGL